MPQQRPAPSSKPHRGLLPPVQPLPAPLMFMTNSGVSRISFRGGGFKIFMEKWDCFMAPPKDNQESKETGCFMAPPIKSGNSVEFSEC